jgi:hypothetical protein
MSQYTFDFLAPYPLAICQDRLSRIRFTEDWEWLTFHPNPTVSFEPMGTHIGFTIKVLLLEISGYLVFYNEGQTRVMGEVYYAPTWKKRQNLMHLVLFILALLMTLGWYTLYDTAGLLCWIDAVVLSYIGFWIHRPLWVTGHEYEAIRAIKLALLT